MLPPDLWPKLLMWVRARVQNPLSSIPNCVFPSLCAFYVYVCTAPAVEFKRRERVHRPCVQSKQPRSNMIWLQISLSLTSYWPWTQFFHVIVDARNDPSSAGHSEVCLYKMFFDDPFSSALRPSASYSIHRATPNMWIRFSEPSSVYPKLIWSLFFMISNHPVKRICFAVFSLSTLPGAIESRSRCLGCWRRGGYI